LTVISLLGPRPPSRGSSVRRVGPPRGSISGPSNPKRPRAGKLDELSESFFFHPARLHTATKLTVISFLGPRPPSRGSSVHSASQGSSVRSVSPPGGSIFGPSNPERPRTGKLNGISESFFFRPARLHTATKLTVISSLGPRPPSRGSSVHSARQGSSVRSVSPPGGSISGSSNPERQREGKLNELSESFFFRPLTHRNPKKN